MIIIKEKIKIYKISYETFNDLYKKWTNHEQVDKLLYLTKKDNVCLAIDNEANEFFVEQFSAENKALCWLIRKDYDASEINSLVSWEIKELIKKIEYEVINLMEDNYELLL